MTARNLLWSLNEWRSRTVGPYDWRYYLTWDGRIGRRDYMVGGQVIGAAGFFAGLGPLLLIMFWTSSPIGRGIAALFLALLLGHLVILGSSLMVRRAHDLGWPALLPIAATLFGGGLVAASFARSWTFGSDVASARWLEIATSTPLVMAVIAVVGFVSLWLTAKEGQAGPNRYGPAV
jgi:uncharacterized membrane protein YhaH (DUF805 family)